MTKRADCPRCGVPVEDGATHRGRECRKFAACREVGCSLLGVVVRRIEHSDVPERSAEQWEAWSDLFYAREYHRSQPIGTMRTGHWQV